MKLPEHLTSAWIDSLANDDLLAVESTLHTAFVKAERAQKKVSGDDYQLLRGPAELLTAWGRWSRVSSEARERGLHVLRRTKR